MVPNELVVEVRCVLVSNTVYGYLGSEIIFAHWIPDSIVERLKGEKSMFDDVIKSYDAVKEAGLLVEDEVLGPIDLEKVKAGLASIPIIDKIVVTDNLVSWTLGGDDE